MSVQSVVVIDDDRITAELITEALEQQLGVDVYSFNRSKQARDFLLQQTNATVSFIISDQMMPDFNGLDLLQACRQAGLTVPFLLLTSDATRDTVMESPSVWRQPVCCQTFYSRQPAGQGPGFAASDSLTSVSISFLNLLTRHWIALTGVGYTDVTIR